MPEVSDSSLLSSVSGEVDWRHARRRRELEGILTINNFKVLLFCVFILSISCIENSQKASFNVVDFGAVGDGKTDDTQAFRKTWSAACGSTENLPTFIVPEGKTFVLNTIIFLGKCKGSEIHFQLSGDIVAYSDPTVMGPSAQQWILFEQIEGLKIDGNGLIDGRGALWWPKRTIIGRPTALSFQSCNKLSVTGIKLANSPRNHIAVGTCNNVDIYSISITAPVDSPNTDGINIGNSNGVVVRHSTIACGDDCVTILGGSSDVNITNVNCGPGHGISIGSLGMNKATDQVSDVHISSCTFTNTQNGARIKSFQGGSGYCRGITFEHLQFDNVDNPIVIDQFYFSPHNYTEAVAISDIEFNDVRGTGSMELVTKLACSSSVPCRDIRFRRVNLTTTLAGRTATAFCFNAEGTISSDSVPPVPCLSTVSLH